LANIIRTEEELLDDIIAVKERLGRIPSKKDYRELGKFGLNTIIRRFGPWNKFLLRTFGSINRERNTPRKPVKCSNQKCDKIIYVSSKEENKKFCSISCSNQYRAKSSPGYKPRKPRKSKKWFCKTCGKEARRKRLFCKECRDKRERIEDRTIGSFNKIQNDANRYNQIREHARKVGKILENKCFVCGYDKHVEVCHKKAIGSFPDDALIREVNDISNLVKLCKNHHWELDHDLLQI
jgi:hypothetical protein